MSRFYASIQGSRGEATREGTAKSGIGAHIRGWEIGVRVIILPNINDEDSCSVSITHGSNGQGSPLFVGTFVKRDGEIIKL